MSKLQRYWKREGVDDDMTDSLLDWDADASRVRKEEIVFTIILVLAIFVISAVIWK